MEESEKIKEKTKSDLIFSPPQTTLKADSPKYYEKVGRKLGTTNERIKEVIIYRLTRKRWPYGFSEWTCWYYDHHYIQKTGRFYAKTKQWQKELKAAKIDAA
jgi:hypothetical protein